MDYESKAFVIHDSTGRIISVGRAVKHARGKVDVRPVKKEHSVIHVELDAEQAAMSVADLHKTHRVHVESKTLLKR
jgi:hypothetical protein